MFPTTSIFILAIIALADAAAAFKLFGSTSPDFVTALELRGQGLNKNDDVPRLGHDLGEVKDKILTNYKTIRNRSSCHTRASAALERSCSELESPTIPKNGDAGAGLIIEETIRAYAARLAVCELQDANTEVPKACMAFTSTEPSTIQKSKQSLDECVAALSYEAQSWTSYSNAKQNVFYICHALSASVRNEEMLDVFEDITKFAAELGEHLIRTPQQARALFNELKSDIEQFRTDSYKRDAAMRQELQQQWNELKGGVEDDILKMVKQLQEGLLKLQAESSQATEENVNIVLSAVNQVSKSATAIAIKHEEHGSAMDEQLQYFAAILHTVILQGIGNGTRGLEVQQELIDANYQSLLHFGIVMADMILSVDSLESRLKAVETGFGSIQKEIGKLQTTANETSATLLEARESAVELRDTFDSIAAFLGSGWTDGLSTLAAFLVFSCGYTLLGFGLWERWAGFSRLGAFCAAMASGSGLAFVSTTHVLPACRRFSKLVLGWLSTHGEIGAHRTMATSGLVVLALFCVCLCYALRHIIRCRRQQAPYDPASPPFPKWNV